MPYEQNTGNHDASRTKYKKIEETTMLCAQSKGNHDAARTKYRKLRYHAHKVKEITMICAQSPGNHDAAVDALRTEHMKTTMLCASSRGKHDAAHTKYVWQKMFFDWGGGVKKQIWGRTSGWKLILSGDVWQKHVFDWGRLEKSVFD